MLIELMKNFIANNGLQSLYSHNFDKERSSTLRYGAYAGCKAMSLKCKKCGTIIEGIVKEDQDRFLFVDYYTIMFGPGRIFTYRKLDSAYANNNIITIEMIRKYTCQNVVMDSICS